MRKTGYTDLPRVVRFCNGLIGNNELSMYSPPQGTNHENAGVKENSFTKKKVELARFEKIFVVTSVKIGTL